jgi:succinate dehydrogenase/fumarate reductase flavoprotein subunit
LVEGALSLRAFYHLANIGVPFPHDEQGQYVGYKTDHDPKRRGTSAGPWTSRYMVQTLQHEVECLGVRIFNEHFLMALLKDEDGAAGGLFLNLSHGARDRFVLIKARNVVMAGGGPGDLFRDSVYAHGQMGPYRVLLEAGAEARNLTEMQFGLASVEPRWNVSGTYQQAIPRYFSTAADGSDEQNFLNDYFETTGEMATAIFLKGYQWPFDPDRTAEAGSSLVDCAVYRERVELGRKVYMDFRENPRAVDKPFAFDELGEQAREYLERSGAAVQGTPIERLAAMNPPSITLYRERGVELGEEALEVGVCAQHCNGGFSVDRWWESTTLGHCFVVGELAGTHGVKRPGGSALNAGQVGAYRAAQRIVRKRGGVVNDETVMAHLDAALKRFAKWLDVGNAGLDAGEAGENVQARMSESCGMLRSAEGVGKALEAMKRDWRKALEQGLKTEHWRAHMAIEVYDLLFAGWAFLEANRAHLEAGAGSRGSHLVIDAEGRKMHSLLGEKWKMKPENTAMRGKVLALRYDNNEDTFTNEWQVLRDAPEGVESWFETVWARYRDGKVYD